MYLTQLHALRATWPEQPERVRVLATRYYIGVETLTSLRALTEPQHSNRDRMLPPLLTKQQFDFIVGMR